MRSVTKLIRIFQILKAPAAQDLQDMWMLVADQTHQRGACICFVCHLSEVKGKVEGHPTYWLLEVVGGGKFYFGLRKEVILL